MQTKLISVAAFSLGLLAAGGASAEGFRGQAKLASPVASATTTSVNQVDWRCEGDTCLGVSDRPSGLDGFMKECRKVAAALGPLAAYSSRGRVMSQAQVENCNTAAKPAAVAQAQN